MIEALLAFLVGAALFAWPVQIAGQTSGKRAARIAKLEAGAPERYFEELRGLRADPLFMRPRLCRVFGAVLMIVSGIMALTYLG